MRTLIWVLSVIQKTVSNMWNWATWLIPFLFNRVWAALLIFVGVFWQMWSKGAEFLSAASAQVKGWDANGGSIGGVNATILATVERLNTLFPVEEAMIYLVAFLSLWVIVFFIRMVLRFVW